MIIINNQYFRKIKNIILNIYHYRDIIINDEWWDSYYIFKVLKVKLKKDIKYYKKYGMHKYKADEIERMQLCINLLDRICNHDYLSNALMFFDKENPHYFDDFFNKTDDRIKSVDTKLSLLYKQSDRQAKQDVDMLFDILKKHVKSWWD